MAKTKQIMIKTCPYCKEEFKTTTTQKIYCSAKCRNKAEQEKIKLNQKLAFEKAQAMGMY